MVDLRVDASALARVASQVRSASSALAWDLHRAGFGVLGDTGVADAAEAAFQQHKARSSVLETSTSAAATYPDQVAERFAEADSHLARSVR